LNAPEGAYKTIMLSRSSAKPKQQPEQPEPAEAAVQQQRQPQQLY